MSKKKKTEPTETLKAFHIQGRNLFCACTGKKCEGECRVRNLDRKRTDASLCPSAYVPQKKRQERMYDDEY